MTPTELKKIENLPSTYVIDVREIDELADILSFAKSVPLSIFQKAFLLQEEQFKAEFGFSKFNETDVIVLICHSGARSGHVAKFLRSQGYNAHNLEGGMLNWQE